MKYVITSPLYYVNDNPHLGSTYTTIACDALARYHRMQEEEVVFITGVDEHGQKIQRTANSRQLEPQLHCDLISQKYKRLWSDNNISYDCFIRTTDNEHKELVYQFYNRVYDSGDIRIGQQKGWYCVGCEEYKDYPQTEKSPKCNIHNKFLEWRDEENLFFCLSKYQKDIERLLENKDYIMPAERKNEITNFVKQGLRDFSISRPNVKWGIKVPGMPDHTFYVWFDALVGYLSGLHKEQNKTPIDITNLKSMGWPATVHLIGKDILRFHSVYWPAMLLSAGLEPPRKIFGHGFLTREGKKMGKTLGNVLDPIELIDTYGIDSVRWFLLKDIQFGNDGDYQENRFKDIINNDLANTIGNLLNRAICMSIKWFNHKVPRDVMSNKNSILKEEYVKTVTDVKKYFDNYQIHKASETILYLAIQANLYLNNMEPWNKIKIVEKRVEVAQVIYDVLETCRIIGILISPITPSISRTILTQLSIDPNNLDWNSQTSWGILPQDIYLDNPYPIQQKFD